MYSVSFIPRYTVYLHAHTNRAKTPKGSSVRTSKPPLSSKIAVFDVIDGEEETGPPQKLSVNPSKLPVKQSPTKIQKPSAPKPKVPNTATKVPVEPNTMLQSGARSSSVSSLPTKTAVQSDSRANTRVAKPKKAAPKGNANDIFLGPLTDSDTKSSPSSSGNSQESSSKASANHLQASPRETVFSVEKQKSATDNDDVWVSAEVQDSQDFKPHTAHTLTQSTSLSSTTSFGCTNTRRAKRLNSTNNQTSTSSKRPRIGSTEQSKGGSKVRGQRSVRGKGVVSEIATRTRSSSRAEEVVKSPLDELLESPVKKVWLQVYKCTVCFMMFWATLYCRCMSMFGRSFTCLSIHLLSALCPSLLSEGDKD